MPQPGSARCDASLVWTPHYLERIASLLGLNETACLRLVNNAAAECFSGKAATIRLSQPVPRWAFQQRWEPPRSCRALTTAQRVKLVQLTASSNDVPNLEVALTAAEVKLLPDLILPAAAAGAMHACRYLSERLGAAVPWTDIAKAAAETGKDAVVWWALERVKQAGGAEGVWEAAGSAARGGHVALLDQLLAEAQEGATRSAAARAAEAAAAARREAWAPAPQQARRELEAAGSHEGGRDGDLGLEDAAVEDAAVEDDAWEDVSEEDEDEEDNDSEAEEDDNEADEEEEQDEDDDCVAKYGRGVIAKAMLGCDLATVQRLIASELGGPGGLSGWSSVGLHSAMTNALSSSTLDWAAKADLVIAAKPGISCSKWYFSMALRLGGEGLERRFAWLKAHGFVPAKAGCPEEVMRTTAAGGRLAALQWLLAEGLSTDAAMQLQLSSAAAGGGHVEVLRFMHQPGSGSAAACELLAELGCPKPDDGGPYLPALWSVPREQQAWWLYPVLKRLGLSYGNLGPRLFMGALERGAPLGLLRQLVAEGFPVPSWAEVRHALLKRVPYADDADVAAWVEGELELERLERQS
ncbi:hypothetical protein HYH03_004981 [Edaphochlamys debaryana]|uniref:Uncharacterized protein n=1 Tax=Edaphochlamys debaryana TaxID=47281 RepID=A0A836C1P3_9CHLO|nr:hypothetical protein HYH03_004981 [Edaphochlamys debaryana]|eukprot:KAG2496975.1 hypothetical protein HYH03_004981 [Edaphochlamys debaryana]